MPYRQRRIDAAIRLAGFGAHDVDEYLARIALFASPAEIRNVRDVLLRFTPRASKRWRTDRERLAAAAHEYASLIARADIALLMRKVAAFYRAELVPDLEQVFELLARPKHDSMTSAQMLGPVAVVEVTDGDPPPRQLPIVAHELFHTWFASSPVQDQVELTKWFAMSADALAGPAYGLLDESFATTFGNGLVRRAVDRGDYERLLQLEDGFYADRAIDATAKALIGQVDSWLERGKTIFDHDVMAAYLKLMRQAVPEGMPPLTYLRPLVFVAQEDLAASSTHLVGISRAPIVTGTSDLDQAGELLAEHPAWGVAVLLTPAHLSRLIGDERIIDRPTLAMLRKQTLAPFVLTMQRAPIGTTFVFVAANDVAMTKLIDAFAAQPAARSGIWHPPS